jgi:hypothetical protein
VIETARMAPGRWDLTFKDPPDEIRSLTSRAFAALVVTPTPVDVNAYSVDGLIGISKYTGIMTARSDDRSKISGFGPAWLLTRAVHEDDSKVVARPLYHGTNTSWIRNNVLRIGVSESNGLSVGSISSSASPTKPGKINAGDTPLKILNDVCRRFSKEWRVNPDGTLDVHAVDTLYPTYTTPTCLATAKAGGRELNVARVASVEFDESKDWDDYTTEVVCSYDAEEYDWGISYSVGDTVKTKLWTSDFYECKEAHTSSAFNQPPNATYWDAVERYGVATAGSVPYKDPFSGSSVVVRRAVSARHAIDLSDAETVAANQLERFDQAQQELTITSDSHSLTDEVAAGDYLWVYDVENGLTNTANEVYADGVPLHPAKVRAHVVREGCSDGYGYYLVSWDSSVSARVAHDLTPHVAFESARVEIELGSPRRGRRRPHGRAVGSGAA